MNEIRTIPTKVGSENDGEKSFLSQFTGNYEVSKTLKFRLIPIGITEMNLIRNILEADKKRFEDSKLVQKFLDRIYKAIINSSLICVELEGLGEYVDLYNIQKRTEKENKQLKEIEKKLRKQIRKAFESFKDDIKFDTLFAGEVFKEVLPEYLETEEEYATVAEFKGLTGYFKDFFTARKNIFTDEEKSCGVAFRCINDNLPKFIDNINTFNIIKENLGDELDALNEALKGIYSQVSDVTCIENCFDIGFFSHFLTQKAIDVYNKVIGGYVTEDNVKIEGINEKVNCFNQKNKTRVPLIKPLYNQILSEHAILSFVPDSFKSDNDLLTTVNSVYIEDEGDIKGTVESLEMLMADFDKFDLSAIYVENKTILKDLSKEVFGNWAYIDNAWNSIYDAENEKKKSTKTYTEKRKKAFNAIESFSIAELEELTGNTGKIVDYFTKEVIKACQNVNIKYLEAEKLLTNPYEGEKRLARSGSSTLLIKNFLDSIKDVETMIKFLTGSGKESVKDGLFYAQFDEICESIGKCNVIYNKARNYLTKVFHLTEKIPLNFNCSQLGGGWSESVIPNKRIVLFKKDDDFYVGILDATGKNAFVEYNCEEDGPYFERMVYNAVSDGAKTLPGVFFSKKWLSSNIVSDEILRIYNTRSYNHDPEKKEDNFNVEDMRKLVDYYKESIKKYHEWDVYNFAFKDTSEYELYKDFVNEFNRQSYKIEFTKVSEDYINQLVEEGKMYLFRLYNKDFSEHSNGRDKLHTRYFKEIFSEENLKDVIYQLKGNAAFFYRKASIPKAEQIVHKAGVPINSKNELSKNSQNVFEYDIVRDRRYTYDSYQMHVSIGLNPINKGLKSINASVEEALCAHDDTYVVGIDRGERNLLYAVVYNKDGIVEQIPLNVIDNGLGIPFNYREKLKEKERDNIKAKRNWATIDGIRKFKDGYLSQAVNIICKLMVKYDAILAIEDLNSSFINNHKKIEYSVYKEFENAIIQKLNYLVLKDVDVNEAGGLRNALQLTNKAAGDSKKGKVHPAHNGLIFYVNPAYTSQLDPKTGFVNLFNTKYTNMDSAKEFFSKFDYIKFDEENNVFEFKFNYNNFMPYNDPDAKYRRVWTVCTYRDRIFSIKNPETGKMDCETVILTDEFKKLFKAYGVECSDDMRDDIVAVNDASFYKEMFKLFKLTVQVRNSLSGDVEIDYLISPVKESKEQKDTLYDSREFKASGDISMPHDADANGAYNIARKALMMVERIKERTDDKKVKISVSRNEWFEYTQTA